MFDKNPAVAEQRRRECWNIVIAWLEGKFGDVQVSELDDRQLLDLMAAMRHEEDCKNCTDLGRCSHSRARIVVRIFTDASGYRHFVTGAELCEGVSESRQEEQHAWTLNESRIPKTRRTCTFGTFVISGGSEKLKAAKMTAMDCADRCSGLILGGNCGAGKTHLAIAMALSVMERGKTSMFFSMPDLLDLMRMDTAKGMTSTLEKAKAVDLLVLDDAGVERKNDWTDEQLYKIIDSRYVNERAIVVTTNAASPDQLKKVLSEAKDAPERGERLISRLLNMTDQVWLTDVPDYRQKDKAGTRDATTQSRLL